ncbi:MAG: nitroreductase family protein [Deltaproteobacteria bacterium]|nr:nitroreductase family protein [Deltaproteobacteria bacterium]
MSGPVGTVIDAARCIGCGLCIQVCPADTLSFEGGVAVVSGEQSLACGHCAAVCPVDAVTVIQGQLPDENLGDYHVSNAQAPSTPSLLHLLGARRSTRFYRSDPVPLPLLHDLVHAGILAPSGTNSQRWTFTLVPEREDVEALGGEIARWFQRLNRLAESKIARLGSRVFTPGDPLGRYWRDHYPAVTLALRQYQEEGRDRLFHGATALIVVGSAPGGSTPVEDAMLATQNILLTAETLGLGSCLIGFAVEALSREASLRTFLDIPAEEQVHAVIALGYPAIRYHHPTGRREPAVRVTRPRSGAKG